jgi:hypothetical protein
MAKVTVARKPLRKVAKPAAKTTPRRSTGATAATARKKTPARRAPATKVAASKSAAKPRAGATAPVAAPKKVVVAKQVIAKQPAAVKAPERDVRKPVMLPASVRTNQASIAPSPKRPPSAPAAVRPPRAVPPLESPATEVVSAEVAIAHFQELLRAKQERIRQGPAYPPANPYTGRHDAPAASTSEAVAAHGPPLSNAPDPEPVYGASATHGHGDQGMRKPK